MARILPVGPGRMGLRLGLIRDGAAVMLPCMAPLLLREVAGDVGDIPVGVSVAIFSRFPFISRFMILAGVTGVMGATASEEDVLPVLDPIIAELGGTGGAGGGMDRSTGEGESPGTSFMIGVATVLPFLCLVDAERPRRRGVEEVEVERVLVRLLLRVEGCWSR